MASRCCNRKNITTLYKAGLILLLLLSSYSWAIDPRLRLEEIKGSLHCIECNEAPGHCHCQCSDCKRPFRIEASPDEQSKIDERFISTDHSCQCSPIREEHDSGKSSRLLRKRGSINSDPVPHKKKTINRGATNTRTFFPSGLEADLFIRTSNTGEEEAATPDSFSFTPTPVEPENACQLVCANMHQVSGSTSPDESIISSLECLHSHTDQSLVEACVSSKLATDSAPINSLSSLPVADGYYILSLAAYSIWWPAALILFVNGWTFAFILNELNHLSCFADNNSMLIDAINQLSVLTTPILLAVQLITPTSFIDNFMSLAIEQHTLQDTMDERDENASSGLSENGSTGSDISDDNQATSLAPTPTTNAQESLLIGLSNMLAINSNIPFLQIDLSALVSAHYTQTNPAQFNIPPTFESLPTVHSENEVISATFISGTYILVINIHGSDHQNSAVVLIKSWDMQVYIMVICINHSSHAGSHGIIAMGGHRSFWIEAMSGLVPNCGTACKLSLYRKQGDSIPQTKKKNELNTSEHRILIAYAATHHPDFEHPDHSIESNLNCIFRRFSISLLFASSILAHFHNPSIRYKPYR